jgi:anaerobic C4-dicarboxylate transporter
LLFICFVSRFIADFSSCLFILFSFAAAKKNQNAQSNTIKNVQNNNTQTKQKQQQQQKYAVAVFRKGVRAVQVIGRASTFSKTSTSFVCSSLSSCLIK